MNDRRPPPAPKRSPGKIIAAVVAVIAVLIVLNIGFGVLMVMMADEQPATAAERELLIDVSLVEEALDFEADPTKASAKRLKYFDGSLELDYTYDDPRETAPFLTHVISYERKSSDALATYGTQWGSAKLMLAATGEDISIVEPADGYRWGEQSSFGIITAGGDPVGNVFVARKGKMVVYIIFSGVFYDDAEAFESTIEPYLEKAAVYGRTL
ncbi:MAG: hypothetical protein RIT81_46465 [Deltaproteobacteria bacterium]